MAASSGASSTLHPLPSTLLVPTWIIDSLEHDSAQIEEDGVRVIHVPRSILPPGAAKGDVLTVGLEQQRRGKREAVRVTITLDRGARRRDSGSDVVL